jgi:hypothetical protein
MPNAIANFGESVNAGIGKSGQNDDLVHLGGVFKLTCYDVDGNLKWEDEYHNLVVSQGLADLNAKYFKGSSYNAAWYLGLITYPGSTVTFAAADTLASNSWTEFTSYTGGTTSSDRVTVSFGTATTATPSVIANTTATGGSPAVYTINASGSIAGAFLTTVQAKSTTGGVLFSEGNFTGGFKGVASGDTVNVTYTFTANV